MLDPLRIGVGLDSFSDEPDRDEPEDSGFDPFDFDSMLGGIDSAWERRAAEKRAEIQYALEHGTRQYDQIMAGLQGPETAGEVVTEGILKPLGAIGASAWESGKQMLGGFGRGVENLGEMIQAPGERLAEVTQGTPFEYVGGAPRVLTDPIGDIIGAMSEPLGQMIQEVPTDPDPEMQALRESAAVGPVSRFGLDVVSQAPQFGAMLAGSAMGLPPPIMAGGLGMSSAGSEIAQAEAQGVGQDDAALRGAAAGLAEYGGELLGTLRSLERVFGPEAAEMAGSAAKQLLGSMGREATEEFATSMAQQIGEATTGGEVPTFSQFLGRALYEAGVAAPLGGVTTGMGMALADDMGQLEAQAEDQAALEAQAFLEAQAAPQMASPEMMAPLAPVPSEQPGVPVASEPPVSLAPEPAFQPVEEPYADVPDPGSLGRGPAGVPVVPDAGELGVPPEGWPIVREGEPPSPGVPGDEGRVFTGTGEEVPLPKTVYRGEGRTAESRWVGEERGPSHIAGEHFATDPTAAAHWARGYGQEGVLTEAVLDVKRPFSVARNYSYADIRKMDPDLAQRAAREIGAEDDTMPIPGMIVHKAAVDRYLERNQLNRADSNANLAGQNDAWGVISAAGYDAIHHEIAHPNQTGKKVDSYAVPRGSPKTTKLKSTPVSELPEEVLEEEAVGPAALAAPSPTKKAAPKPPPPIVSRPKPPAVAEDTTTSGEEGMKVFSEEAPSRPVKVGERTLHPTPLPEILEIAKEGIGDLPIDVKAKLKKGMLAGFWRSGDKGRIKVLAKMGGEAQQLAATVAHEFGHALDYFPDKTMKRGNVLGRLASGFKDMRTEFVSRGNTIPTKELRKELVELSDAWRPGLKSSTGKQLQYRMRGEELYADFVSALMRRPELVSKLAPRSLDIFLDHLGRKADFESAWSQVQGRIQAGESKVMEHRRSSDVEMFRAGRERRFAAMQPKKKTATEIVEGARSAVSRAFVDEFGDLYRIAKKSGERVKGPLADALRAVQESRYSSSAQAAYVEDAQKLVRDFTKESGTDWDDLGTYLFYRRAGAEDRTKIAPGGRSYVDYEKLVQDWGKEKVADVERFVADWHQIRRRDVIDPAIASGIASEPLAKKMVSNPGYVRFFVQDFMDSEEGGLVVQSLGMNPLKKRVGTFKDIGDPILETVLGDLALIRAADANRAASKAVSALERIPGAVAQVKAGKLTETDPKRGEVHFLRDGKLHTASLPRGIADAFAKDDGTQEGWAAYDAVHNVVRNLILTYNPAWAVRNVFRDVRQFRRNVMGTKELAGAYDSELGRYVEAILTPFAAFKWFAKGAKIARREIKTGTKSELRKEMLRNRALLVGKDASSLSEVELDRQDTLPLDLVASVFNPDQAESLKKRNAFMRMIHAVGKALRHFGEVSELGTKYGGYMYLKEMQSRMKAKGATAPISNARIAELTRTQVGTPDIRRRGSAHGLLNRIFMFANVGKEGWRSSGEAAKADPALYATKLLTNTVAPKILLAMAAKGFLDDDDDEPGKRLSDVIRKIPDYRKRYFDVIPLFTDDKGKAWYISLPKDHLSMAVGGYIWSALGGGDRDFDSEDVRKAALQMLNDIPWSPANFHPVIEASLTPALLAAGISPTDYFRGKDVIPDVVMKEGGPDALKMAAEHAYESLGGSVLSNLRPPASSDEGIMAWLESLLKPDLTTPKGVYDWATSVPFVGGALRSLVSASDFGDYEGLAEINREEERAAARRSTSRDAVLLEELAKPDASFDRAWEKLKELDLETKRYGDAKRQYQKLSLLNRKAGLSAAQRFAVKSSNKEVEKKALEQMGFDLPAIEQALKEEDE